MMKLTKQKLQQMIQEELTGEGVSDIVAALKGKAGLPRTAQTTKGDRPVVPQDWDEPESERDEVDLGPRGPTNKEQLLDAGDLLTDKLGRDLKETDIGVLYDLAMYMSNYGTPDDRTLEKIINMERAFDDMPMAIHQPSR